MAQASHRLAPRYPPDVLPASQFLQERLQERRARNTRPKKSRQSDVGPQTTTGRDDDIFITEGDSNRIRLYDSTSSKYEDKRAPGVRQLDEQVDRLNKENFHLKLEIDHRRTHQAKLEAKLKDADALNDVLQREHAELMRINTELVEELEKRDKAMQEAVDIICELEEKVEDLEDDRRSATHSSTIHADSGYAGTETLEQASPARARILRTTRQPPATTAASRDLNEILSDSSPPKVKRRPLFLSQKKPSTNALRSVYLKSGKQLHSVKSFHSILSKHASTIEDEESDALPSPHFSNLSESSFSGMYTPKKPSPDRHAWEPEDDTAGLGIHARQHSISRVSQWIDGHELNTPSKGPATTSIRTLSPTPTTMPANDDGYQSLNNALSRPQLTNPELFVQELPYRATPSDLRRSSRTPTSFGGPIFGEPLLSPSPDSASQRLLRSSRSTIIGERSVTDNTPLYFKNIDNHNINARTAPKQMRSSVELNSAFVSNLEYRKTGLSQVYLAEETLSALDDDDVASIALRDYYGYPDGNSILGGTPSRFLHQSKPDPVRQPTRRKSSSAATSQVSKPSLARAGTSPNMLPQLMTDVGKTPRGDVKSPVSCKSTSSSNRTAYGQHRPLSPEPLSPPRKPPSRGIDRVSASPARPTLTQKTQQLFRRLSSSHGSDREPMRDQLISPTPSRPTLPTLTSTPSSAYVNVIPKEMRRANGQTSDTPKTTPVQTPVSSRTRGLSEARATTPATDNTVEKRGFFGRRGSFKDTLERAKSINNSNRGRRRRSSVKDAPTPSRRPWP